MPGAPDTSGRDRGDPRGRALLSLDGLSIGDAFGERFFTEPSRVADRIEGRVLPEGPWRFTDDTVQACAVVASLLERGEIEGDGLAEHLLHRWARDPARGYGGGAHRFFRQLVSDRDWRRHSEALFGGTGSFGNGAAMRVAPLGAWFADDLERVVAEADRSARVTHAHPEGRAGAVAVALAAAVAWRCRGDAERFRASVWDICLRHTPASEVRDGIERARDTPLDASVHLATNRLGNGSEISAQDTVPFVLWCAARCVDDFVEAMWTTVRGLGDRDTTCAMVGGIVALALGRGGLPEEWWARRESPEGWWRVRTSSSRCS